MKYFARWLLAAILCRSAGPVMAQFTYCPVIPMPELPGGGGVQAIVAAIGQHITYPPQALQADAQGWVCVTFVVMPSGRVRGVAIVKPFRPDCDAVVERAVRRLPRFKPRLARYGPVRYTAPIAFRIAGAKPVLGPLSRSEFYEAARKAVLGRNSTP